MFTLKTETEPTDLESAITELLAQLTDVEGDTERYSKMVDQLTKLYKLKEIDSPKRVSPDTWVVVAGNLLGIAMIIGHERVHVLGSKALGFVMKLR